MSRDFAKKLWPITKLGVRVIVARDELTPTDFSHAKLFVPSSKPAEPQTAMNAATEGAAQPKAELAEAMIAHPDRVLGDAASNPIEAAPVSGDAVKPSPTVDPPKPLMAVTEDGIGVRWNLMTVPTDPSVSVEHRHSHGRSKEPPKPVVQGKPPSTATQALDRIHLPQQAVDRIGELLVPGSSLVVSDEGLGRETGRGTEFIVLTR